MDTLTKTQNLAMKETAFDVLLYLFESYMHGEHAVTNSGQIEQQLSRAGFASAQIDSAFDWLEGLAEQRGPESARLPRPSSLRIFSREESQHIDFESQSFLLQLHSSGVLNAEQRERVLDRLLALDDELIDIERTKWVILMVLFNQPGEETAFAHMEQLVFDGPASVYH